ncbi:endo alpha-1,4 polygalactosaminidase, partial [Kineosporia sp. A_224]|uniref:endo alpha-1,4 polygalactosaminidase n=1 Tax=Kineosporia sp. A_224 TaxID=1962180 RepID=UPI001E529505
PSTTPTATSTSVRPPTATRPPTTTQPAPGSITLPPADGVLDYQIGGAYQPDADVDIVDRDHTDDPVPGKYNICYVNGYQTQPGSLGSWPAGAVLRDASGDLVEDKGWPGEYMLDTRTAASRDLVAGVVHGWMTGCRDAGFDAVEIDNLDTYTRTSLLTQAGNLALATLFVRDAHALGLAIGQKNTVEIAAQGRRQIGFDFAIAEECQVYDECGDYMSAYGNQVYEVEYPDAGGRSNFERACAARGARISITYRDRNVAPRGRSSYVFEHC